MKTIARVMFYVFASWNPLYWIAAKYHFSKWEDFDIIGPDTDLLIESTGAAASGAFIEYVRKWNPEINLATRTHCVYPMSYAVRRNIPVIFLWRDYYFAEASARRRFPQFYNPLVFALTYHLLFGYMHWRAIHMKLTGRKAIYPVMFETLLEHPAEILGEANRVFGLNLNPGDGVLPNVTTAQDVPLNEARKRAGIPKETQNGRIYGTGP